MKPERKQGEVHSVAILDYGEDFRFSFMEGDRRREFRMSKPECIELILGVAKMLGRPFEVR